MALPDTLRATGQTLRGAVGQTQRRMGQAAGVAGVAAREGLTLTQYLLHVAKDEDFPRVMEGLTEGLTRFRRLHLQH